MYLRYLAVTLALVLTTLQTKVKILDTPNRKPHPEPCAMICSGIARSEDGKWYDSWVNKGKAGRDVDMGGCNFASAPVITVSAHGWRCPAVHVTKDIGSARFALYTVNDVTAEEVEKNQCGVYWVAAGYDCD